MEEIVAEGAVSNSNLRQLIDKIVIYETADGLDIRIRIQANFTTHMKIYDGEGEQQADLEVIDHIIPNAMKRRMKPE